MAEREREPGEGKPGEVIITDLRHRRDVDEQLEAEAPAEQEPVRPVHALRPEAEQAAGLHEASRPESAPTADEVTDGGEDYFADESAPGEMAYLRQVFSAGLVPYLRSQLGLLLNFALLGLGRAPDPSTGIVAKNLAHARIAIDLLEQIVLRLDSELQAPEKVQMKALISDLKYAYMQAISAGGEGPVGA